MHLTARIDIHHATDELLYIDLYHVCIYIYVHLCTCIATAQLIIFNYRLAHVPLFSFWLRVLQGQLYFL